MTAPKTRLPPIFVGRRILGHGAQLQAMRLEAMASPPLPPPDPAPRQFSRRMERKAEKAFLAQTKQVALKARRRKAK